MATTKSFQAHKLFNKLVVTNPELAKKDETYLGALRVWIIPLVGMNVKPRASGNGHVTLHYQGGFITTRTNKEGVHVTHPFQNYMGLMVGLKPITLVEQENNQVVCTSMKEGLVQKYDEETGDLVPYNVRLNHNTQLAKEILMGLTTPAMVEADKAATSRKRGDLYQDISESCVECNATWGMYQEILPQAGNFQIQLLVGYDESIAEAQIGKPEGMDTLCFNYTLKDGLIFSYRVCMPGDELYYPGLALPQTLVDVDDIFEVESKKSVIKMEEIANDKAKPSLRKLFGKFLKGKENTLANRDSFIDGLNGLLAQWVVVEGNRAKAHAWLEKTTAVPTARTMGMGKEVDTTTATEADTKATEADTKATEADTKATEAEHKGAAKGGMTGKGKGGLTGGKGIDWSSPVGVGDEEEE